MQCPKCGLFNPETAQRCDCGFDFPSGRMKGSLLSARELAIASEQPQAYVPFKELRLLVRRVSAAYERWSPAGRRRRQMKKAYFDKLRREDDENRMSAGRRS
jgi:hypothetical protein